MRAKSILSIFDASNKIRDEFISHGFSAKSLDITPGKKNNKVDIVTDILDFDYISFNPGHFAFLFIALPCQTYSIASCAFHFKKNVPVTSTAVTAINILIKIYQITEHFKCPFIIENPSGGLCNNSFFNSFFDLQISRVSLKSYGFPTQKKTDLFSNFSFLMLNNPTHRVNGKYQAHKLDNFGYRKKVTYPERFVKDLVLNVILQLQLYK